MAAKRSGCEQSSLITQTQSVCVCSRIDSIWRRKSAIGGSQVVMQIATDAPASTGSTGGAAGVVARAASSTAAPASRARSASVTGAETIRARPQKPLRYPSGSLARSVSSRGIPNPPSACSSPSTSSTSDSTCSPGAKHVPATNSAVPAPTARSAGTGGSRPTRSSGKARPSPAPRRFAPSLPPMLTPALRRVKRVLRRPPPPPAPPRIASYDGWLALVDDELAPIEAACAAGERDVSVLFAGLDVDLWALLLTQEYSAYPH